MTKKKSLMIVVSLLLGTGPTGVETHFNLVMDYGRSKKISTILVTPQDQHWILRKPANFIFLILKTINNEYSILWGRLISYLWMRMKLQSLILKNTDNNITIYAQDPLSAASALSVRKNNNCRVVAVCHFNYSEASEMVEKGITTKGSFLWKVLMNTEKNNLSKVDRLIFVSKYMSKIINERLPLISNISQAIIPNYSSKYLKDSISNELLMGDLIAIGTLEQRKNQSYLIHVLAACKRLGKVYQLTLVGDGPDRHLLNQLAFDLEVNSQVNFLGFVSNASDLISSHRILVHAAKIENSPIVIVEALSRGRPVICAAVGGIPEIITENIEGNFWDLDDPESGATILINLIEDPLRWLKMSQQALTTSKNRFDADTLAAKWLDTIMLK